MHSGKASIKGSDNEMTVLPAPALVQAAHLLSLVSEPPTNPGYVGLTLGRGLGNGTSTFYSCTDGLARRQLYRPLKGELKGWWLRFAIHAFVLRRVGAASVSCLFRFVDLLGASGARSIGLLQ